VKDDADRAFRSQGPSTAGAAVARFTTWSIVTLVTLAIGTVVVADQIARHQALEYAGAQGAGVAHRLAAPLVDDAVRRDPTRSGRQLDLVMGNRMADGSLQHVKLWDTDGRIIWADNKNLIGDRFELEDDVSVLFGTTDVTAEVSDLSKEENLAERDEGELLEVYAGTFDADGQPLVFEAYLPVDRMEDDARTIVATFVPLVLGALVLLLGIVLPLAVSLTRRVERAQREQSRMMRHALLASDLERRRIAADLHDGVIQDLAGLGYALPTVSRELEGDPGLDTARSVLDRATAILHRDTTMLRSMMVDLYPPDLEGRGLVDAVRQLVQSEAIAAGLVADVELSQELSVTQEAGRLVYRVVREAVRNVVKHAGAGRILVRVQERDGQVRVLVQDDGVGPGATPGVGAEGHLGLTLLRDTVADFGGGLDLEAGPEGGTILVAHFPSTPVPT
jgi:signal transduction histidine kinase